MAKRNLKAASKEIFIKGVKDASKGRDVREQWLRGAVKLIAQAWAPLGVVVPADVQVSCSFPGGGSAHKRIGECWPRGRSKASVNEMFINPVLADSTRVLDVLGHEMLHAADDCASKHGATFTKNSKKVGYSGGKHSHADTGPAHALIVSVITSLGAYPHQEVVITKKARNNAHGLHKFTCPSQGANLEEGAKPDVLYSTQKMVEVYGVPVCRCCGEEMILVDREKKNLIEYV